jgi:molecular chaperone DnaK (HSP70)
MITAPDGSQTFDYRVISADEANTDLGDLVASAIELMTTQVPREAVQLNGISVAYRDRDQTHSIRSAVGTQRRDLRLVPESAAALSYLRYTGDLAEKQTVGICDFGASGLTVTVMDQIDGSVLETQRTEAISGNAMDELVYHLLARRHNIGGERGRRPNRGMLTIRGRTAKEHLSTARAVTIDHVAGRPVELTRDDLESLIGGLLHEAAVFVSKVLANAPRRPELLAVIGGGANIPAVSDMLVHHLGLPVLAVDEPEAAIAKGAALIADSTQANYPVVSLGNDQAAGTLARVGGLLAGAVVVVGLVVGYGVQTLTSHGNSVTPAGTSDSTAPTTSAPTQPTTAVTAPIAPVQQTMPAASTTTTAPTTPQQFEDQPTSPRHSAGRHAAGQ